MRLTKFDEIVSMAKIKLASLPYLRDEDKMKFEMKKMNMRDVNKKIMTKTLGYFRWHNLLHDVTKLLGLIRHLDHEESEIFDIDLRRVVKHCTRKFTCMEWASTTVDLIFYHPWIP